MRRELKESQYKSLKLNAPIQYAYLCVRDSTAKSILDLNEFKRKKPIDEISGK